MTRFSNLLAMVAWRIRGRSAFGPGSPPWIGSASLNRATYTSFDRLGYRYSRHGVNVNVSITSTASSCQRPKPTSNSGADRILPLYGRI